MPGRGAPSAFSAPAGPSARACWRATVAGLAVPGYLAVLAAAQWLASRVLALASGLPSVSLAHPMGVSQTAAILLGALCNLLALAAAGCWAVRQAKLRLRALRLGAPRRRAKNQSRAEAAFGPVFLAVSLLLGAAGAAAGQRLGLPARPVLLPAGGLALAASFLAVCLVPAAGEEMFFRGVLPAALRPLGPGAAVWGAALLFALAHGSLPQCLAALWAGLALGWYAHRRGSVWPGAALHLCHNSLNFCGSWLQSYAGAEAASLLTGLYLAALALWLAAALLRARRNTRNRHARQAPQAPHPAHSGPDAEPARAENPAVPQARGGTKPAVGRPARVIRTARPLQALFACPGYRLALLGLAALAFWRWVR